PGSISTYRWTATALPADDAPLDARAERARVVAAFPAVRWSASICDADGPPAGSAPRVPLVVLRGGAFASPVLLSGRPWACMTFPLSRLFRELPASPPARRPQKRRKGSVRGHTWQAIALEMRA